MATLFLIFIILYWEKLLKVINAIKQSYSSVLNCSGEGGFVESVRGLVFHKNYVKWGEGTMIFIFPLLPEMVDTLILLLELMCFL